MNRCENGFDSEKQCQCDSMCKYYKSCCSDYEVTCGMLTGPSPSPGPSGDSQPLTAVSRQPSPTRPPLPDFNQRPHPSAEMTRAPRVNQRVHVTPKTPVSHTVPPSRSPPCTTAAPQTNAAVGVTTDPTTTTTGAPDPDAQVCSGRPFDSFMQVKNGSMYAFRGEYFFELDQKSVLPGYPKLIKDVWGISGPIDAAFTRVNCQGKTYIFKGTKYWRFEDGVLDDDYPRDISVGFDRIPDHLDAAFALPASSHNGREKVYFFKGEQYYTYEFLHQPSHGECIKMSASSPSALFRRYTDVYYHNYERFLMPQHHDNHHFINKDWKGLRAPVDAAMVGRMYVPMWRSGRRNDYRPDQQWGRQQGQQWGQPWGQQWGQQWDQQWGQRRRSRSAYWNSMAERGMAMGQEFERLGRDWDRQWDQDWDQDRRRDGYRRNNNRGNYDSRDDRYWDYFQRSLPMQTVYFFKGDKYYRVDLRTKRVDPAVPSYPRSIARYWLGCSDTTGSEK
uniref:Vitronectin a n=1 Tax=Salarias fasciatus TaxID=181472 RepID=A0A672JG83_SALFA